MALRATPTDARQHNDAYVASAPRWTRPATILIVVCIAQVFITAVTLEDLESIVGASAIPSTRFLVATLAIGVVCAAAFRIGSAGVHVAQWAPRNGGTTDQIVLVKTRQVVEILLFLGYTVWLATALGRGMTAQPLIDFATAQPGASSVLKENYLAPVAGIGLLVNLTLVFAGVNTAVAVRQIDDGEPRALRRIIGALFARKTFASLVVIILLRAVLTSERLTLFELVIPVAVVAAIATSRRVDHRIRWGRTLLVGAAVGVVFFGATEFTRSFVDKRSDGLRDGVVGYTVDRLSLYYSVPEANSSVALRESPDGTLLSFPWVGEYFGAGDTSSWANFLRTHANVEFNNGSGWFSPMIDFGLAGGLIIVAIAWLVLGYTWQRGMWRMSVGAIACPLAAICALEMPRIFYIGQSRALPSIVALVVVLGVQRNRPRSDHLDN